MRLIDADKLRKCFYDDGYGEDVYGEDELVMQMRYSSQEVIEVIDSAPTIDAVPVVRRKDWHFHEIAEETK